MADAGIPPRAESCKTCKFFGPKSTLKANFFTCRRFPPKPHPIVSSRDFRKDHYKGIMVWTDNISDVSLWPQITPDLWCGEYVERG